MTWLRIDPEAEKNVPTLDTIKGKFGFVPNFFRAQTMRPDLIDAEAQLAGAILVKEGALTRQQKEYIFLVCSAANMSTYCVTAHCEMVRMLGIEGPEPEQIAIDYRSSDLPMKLKALLRFATKLNSQPNRVCIHDIDALRTYGYTEQQIHETVVVVGFAKFANLVAFGLGAMPDFDSLKIVLDGAGAAAVA
jgi:uncharacterized peroxidase-related enzyme